MRVYVEPGLREGRNLGGGRRAFSSSLPDPWSDGKSVRSLVHNVQVSKGRKCTLVGVQNNIQQCTVRGISVAQGGSESCGSLPHLGRISTFEYINTSSSVCSPPRHHLSQLNSCLPFVRVRPSIRGPSLSHLSALMTLFGGLDTRPWPSDKSRYAVLYSRCDFELLARQVKVTTLNKGYPLAKRVRISYEYLSLSRSNGISRVL